MSVTLCDDSDLAGDLERAEADGGEMLERDRKWPRELRGFGLALRCGDQAAIDTKLSSFATGGPKRSKG